MKKEFSTTVTADQHVYLVIEPVGHDGVPDAALVAAIEADELPVDLGATVDDHGEYTDDDGRKWKWELYALNEWISAMFGTWEEEVEASAMLNE